MSTQYTSPLGLPYPEKDDPDWDEPLVATIQLLAGTFLGSLSVWPADPGDPDPLPSQSLRVSVAAGTFQAADGSLISYPGSLNITLPDGANTYLWLDDQGDLQQGTAFPDVEPESPHVRLARVATADGQVTHIQDRRIALSALGLAAGSPGDDLPDQSGQDGKWLQTDNSEAQWATITTADIDGLQAALDGKADALPDMDGHAGDVLAVNNQETGLQWITLPSGNGGGNGNGDDGLPDQDGQEGKWLYTNGDEASWSIITAADIDGLAALLATKANVSHLHGIGDVEGLGAWMLTKADDNAVVHIAGNETIIGDKEFIGEVRFGGGTGLARLDDGELGLAVPGTHYQEPLPSMTGQAGKVLGVDGLEAGLEWVEVSAGELQVDRFDGSTPIDLGATDVAILDPEGVGIPGLSLPNPTQLPGRSLTIKRVGLSPSESDPIYLNAEPFLIDGEPGYTLRRGWQSLTIVSDGANWFKIAEVQTSGVILSSQLWEDHPVLGFGHDDVSEFGPNFTGVVSIVMPNAAYYKGQTRTIKRLGGEGYTLRITATGMVDGKTQSIDGLAEYDLEDPWQSVTLYSDGVWWLKIAETNSGGAPDLGISDRFPPPPPSYWSCADGERFTAARGLTYFVDADECGITVDLPPPAEAIGAPITIVKTDGTEGTIQIENQPSGYLALLNEKDQWVQINSDGHTYFLEDYGGDPLIQF